MRQIVLIAFLAMFALFAVAPITNVSADEQVTFQWDHASDPPADGYQLFVRQQNATYDYSTPIWQGPEKTYSATLADGNYAAVVRAYVGTSISADSNEVIFSVAPPPPALIIPPRPAQLIIKFE